MWLFLHPESLLLVKQGAFRVFYTEERRSPALTFYGITIVTVIVTKSITIYGTSTTMVTTKSPTRIIWIQLITFIPKVIT